MSDISSLLSTVGHLFRWNDLVPTLRFVPLGGARGRIHGVVACADRCRNFPKLIALRNS